MAIECNAKINKKNDIAGKNYHFQPKKRCIHFPKDVVVQHTRDGH
jgi:hypothetical protein